MACALTTGYTLDCRDSVGGIKEVKFGTFATHTVTSTTGTVSALTTSGWYKYDLRPETADFVETETENDTNGTVFYDSTLNIVINKMSTTMRNELRLLTQNRLLVAFADRNGKYWLAGWCNGMTKSGTAVTGKAMGDMNGFTVALKGKEELPFIEIPSNIYSTLVP